MITNTHIKIFSAAAVLGGAGLALVLAVGPAPRAPLAPGAQSSQTAQKPAENKADQSTDMSGAVKAAIGNLDARALQEPVAGIYEHFSYAMLWTGDRTAKARLKRLVDALAKSQDDAVVPEALMAAVETLRNGASTGQAAVQADVMVTAQLVRHGMNLSVGIVSSKALGPDWTIPPQSFDAVPWAITVVDGKDRDADAYWSDVEPTHAPYVALTKSLVRYRALAADGGWPVIPGTDEVKLDGTDARIGVVRDRLIAEGYLPRSQKGIVAKADDALHSALREYQMHNGLQPDMRVGRGTLAAMNITADERVAQIAVSLERWRHLPRSFGASHVAVNIADASVVVVQHGAPVSRLAAVVGDKNHHTPVLAAKISAVTLNPGWSIPPSIAGKEILPKLRANPSYLADNNMRIVGRDDGDPTGADIDWHSYNGKALPFRFKQAPGAINALGLVKFEMANPHDVYLHDTPSRNKFAQASRFLSHGCVRVDQPQSLAKLLLGSQPEWNSEAFDAALATGQTRSVSLRTPVPVYLLYFTAFADDTGAIQFRPDTYGWDAPVSAAMGLREKGTAKPARSLQTVEDVSQTRVAVR